MESTLQNLFQSHIGCKTLIGKNDYLFLINDRQRELFQHFCFYNINTKNIENKLIEQNTYCNGNYLFAVFPDKSVVLSEFLPFEYNELYRPIVKNISKLDFVLDLKEIVEKNDKYIFFYKFCTHMNHIGSYIIYVHLIQLVSKKLNIDIEILENFEILDKEDYIGDLLWDYNLGHLKVPYKSEIDKLIQFDSTSIQYYVYDLKLNECNNMLYRNDNLNMMYVLDSKKHDLIFKTVNSRSKNRIKILVFHDSFMLRLIPFFSYSIFECYFSWNKFNKGLIDSIKPDIVLECTVERFLLEYQHKY